MANSRFVLDTNAIIFLASKGNSLSSELQNELNEADLFASVITEIELFAKPRLPPEEEKTLRAFLANNIPVVDIDGAIKAQTIALRRAAKAKLPDAIIAATSIILNAPLLTNDSKLLSLNWSGFAAKSVGSE
jgi:predicted nucleic acid-binding protein